MRDLKRPMGFALLALLILALGIGGFYASKPGRFPIKQIEVQGDYRFVTQEAIADTIVPFTQQGFFHVPVVEAQQTLENLPGVEDATIRRIWPDTVQVTLVEQAAIGRWPDGHLLTAQGMLFMPVKKGLGDDLPLFAGPESDALLMATEYDQFQPMLATTPFHIQKFTYQPGVGWSLLTDNNINIILGTNHLPLRLARFVAAYPILMAQNPKKIMDYADMEYKNGFAVRWKSQTKKPAPPKNSAG